MGKKTPPYTMVLFATVLLKYTARHIATSERQRTEAAAGGVL